MKLELLVSDMQHTY